MRVILELSHVRSPSPVSPCANTPNSKALLFGLNYFRRSAVSEPEDPSRPTPLGGPVRDVEEIKSMLMDVYDYREEDIVVMTDEEKNIDTERWPSKENMLRAIDKFVVGASPGDAFVFFYAGHCAKGEDEDKRAYILSCDDQKIFDSDVREHLVNPLPQGSRLTAIIDACHSGMLLGLDHYNCRCVIRRRCQSFLERKKPVVFVVEPKRRHTEAAVQSLLTRRNPQLRATFKRAVTMTIVITRMQFLAMKKARSGQRVAGHPLLPSRCGSFCAYERSNGPLVIGLSACAYNERTWEDSKRMGKGMTVKLVKILRKNPSIQVGDLNQQLQKCLSKLAFKRVRAARGVFRTHCENVPLKKRKKLEQKYRDLLEYRGQTAQFGSLNPLRLEDQFILKRGNTDFPH